MNILSISAFNSDPGVLLFKEETPASFCSEKWLIKNFIDKFPINSVNFCLQSADLTIQDIDCIICFEKPYLKFEKEITGFLRSFPYNFKWFYKKIPLWLEKKLSFSFFVEKYTDYKGEILYINNDLSNSVSSYYLSSFKMSDVIVCDEHQGWSGISRFVCANESFLLKDILSYPNSILDLISAFMSFMGIKGDTRYESFSGMALLGENDLKEEFKKIIDVKDDGSYRIANCYFDYQNYDRPYKEKFVKLFGKPLLNPEDCNQKHYDMIFSLHNRVEKIVLGAVQSLLSNSDGDNICFSGTLFKNSVLNSLIIEKKDLHNFYFDTLRRTFSGLFGATIFAKKILKKEIVKIDVKTLSMISGPEFNRKKIKRFLSSKMIDFNDLDNSKLVIFLDEQIKKNGLAGICNGAFSMLHEKVSDFRVVCSKREESIDRLCKYIDKHFAFRALPGVMVLENDLENVFDISKSLLKAITKNSTSALFSSKLNSSFVYENNLTSLSKRMFKINIIRENSDELFYNLLRFMAKKERNPILFTCPLYFDGVQLTDINNLISEFKKSDLNILVLENYVIKN